MSEHVEVWRQPDGGWRWRFVADEGGELLELLSNSAEATCEEAVEAARTAYPDLTVVVDRPSDETADGTAGRSHLVRWAGTALVLLLVAVRRRGLPVLVLLAVAAVAVAARARRRADARGSGS
ncbi:hypothetical protein [Blastococcus tunisiensis]|uniref:DUF1508 domain-containing protein n=1 Tax=Blastococcus tunisiensis TaxID=1798228 RepID=A0A1I2DTX9_9ACTN|nr:hypothetical protein [Blastococcus sp. DSM 46838]SFE83380.1 hypothetical protein SAMN05216574_106104 [Blastococcus sp. DSM 46838]